MLDLISIIVPCYNQAIYLEETLQSVLSQSISNWECIIVNDGSTDNTESIAKKWTDFDSRFKYFFTENKGVSHARNLGIEISSGNFIQFLDGDDLLDKNKLEYQLEILKNEQEISIVYGLSQYFFDGNKENRYAIHYRGIVPAIIIKKNDKNQKDIVTIKNICTNCAALYRRKIFDVVKFRDIIYEDWFFNLECSLNNFIFHFSNKYETDCLIRMTKQSQMNLHELDNNRKIDFKKQFDELLTKKDFLPTLTPIDNSFVKEVPKKNLLKDIFENITPPVITKIFNKFFTK